MNGGSWVVAPVIRYVQREEIGFGAGRCVVLSGLESPVWGRSAMEGPLRFGGIRRTLDRHVVPQANQG